MHYCVMICSAEVYRQFLKKRYAKINYLQKKKKIKAFSSVHGKIPLTKKFSQSVKFLKNVFGWDRIESEALCTASHDKAR